MGAGKGGGPGGILGSSWFDTFKNTNFFCVSLFFLCICPEGRLKVRSRRSGNAGIANLFEDRINTVTSQLSTAKNLVIYYKFQIYFQIYKLYIKYIKKRARERAKTE